MVESLGKSSLSRIFKEAFTGQARGMILYYGIFLILFTIIQMLLASFGVFFHFLLGHEISIVESWLHTNAWETSCLARLTALVLSIVILKLKSYRVYSPLSFFKKQFRWPDGRILVLSVFNIFALVVVNYWTWQPSNNTFWTYHLVAFVGSILWLGCDYYFLALLHDLFNIKTKNERLAVYVTSIFLFWVCMRVTIPDYYHLGFLFLFHLTTLFVICSRHMDHWINALTYFLLNMAPMTAWLGLDPFWGGDFSPLRLKREGTLSSLLVIWMLSFLYYRYRHRWRALLLRV